MLVPLLFPDGRVMSRRWGAVAVLLLVSAAMAFVGSLVLPGELEMMPGVENPVGVPALAEVGQLLIGLGGMGSLVCLPFGIVAAILRYRRGTPVERKQLKWFGSVLVLAFSAFFAATILPQPYGQWSWILASLCMGLIPIAIGVAVLRYRLYDIDRIVSRTLSYALVTGVLALVFIGTNLAVQSVLSLATEGSTLTVAASTLVVAALFQPVRRRIQAPIDRRFNRTRNDAELVVARFSARTRDEVDLDQLHGSVITTIQEAVHPAGAGLWLRQAR
jgi:membrane protein implicated in regulation of membrane protease activity